MLSLQDWFKANELICARWCIDSETGEECLIDMYENKIIAKRVCGVIIDPSTPKE